MLLTISYASYAVNINLGKDQELFVCNAGIMTPQQDGLFCQNQFGESCRPSDCEEVNNCNCTCYEQNPRSNFLLAELIPLDAPPSSSTQQLVSQGELFEIDESFSWQLIKNLQVSLGSALYGAEYFVDFCYLAPPGNVNSKVKKNPKKTYVQARVKWRSGSARDLYWNKAQVAAKLYGFCDFTIDGFTEQWDFYHLDFAPIRGKLGEIELVDREMFHGESYQLKRCHLRFVFREMSGVWRKYTGGDTFQLRPHVKINQQ